MADAPATKYRLEAAATFRPDDEQVIGTDNRGFIRAGDSFVIEDDDTGRGGALRRRLLNAGLADAPSTTIIHRGGGWYDVVDADGIVLNIDGAIQGGKAAQEFAQERTDYDPEE